MPTIPLRSVFDRLFLAVVLAAATGFVLAHTAFAPAQQSPAASQQPAAAVPQPANQAPASPPAIQAPAPQPDAPAAAQTGQPQAGEVTEEQLKQKLVGKTFYLRGGYLDDSLTFNEHGELSGHSPKGSYTLSLIEVSRVRLLKHKVEIEGIRYGLHFLGALPYEDPTASVDKVRITPKKKVVRITIDREMVVKPKKVQPVKVRPEKPGKASAGSTPAAAVAKPGAPEGAATPPEAATAVAAPDQAAPQTTPAKATAAPAEATPAAPAPSEAAPQAAATEASTAPAAPAPTPGQESAAATPAAASEAPSATEPTATAAEAEPAQAAGAETPEISPADELKASIAATPEAERPADPTSVTTTTSPAHAAQLLQDALDAVLAPGLDDRMMAAMPEFWKLYYQAAAAKTDYHPSDPTVMRQSTVDKKARLVTIFEPESNHWAQENGVAGMALYYAVIGPDGQIREIAVGRPIGFGLDENAVEDIRKAKFEPAMKDGKPVSVLLDLVVQFRIFSKRTAAAASSSLLDRPKSDKPDEPILPGPYSVPHPPPDR
jgi:hypothetical protein